jgi:mycofactocin precursor
MSDNCAWATLISAPGAFRLIPSAGLALGATTLPEARMDDQTTQAEETLSDDELLVEEVSIDGMCGVY